MIDLATYLCGLGAGIIIGAAITSILFRRGARAALAAKRENAELVRLLDLLQRAELSYRQTTGNRGFADPATHAALERLCWASSAARDAIYRLGGSDVSHW
ncbi:hypothetical protein [Afipia carboxidovorans]|uniref:hypothetical protein n=1 Tax=Afipia carboxidovorans TaxID=40137 RepID=UPI0030936D65|nr:hypothetical protein CRBSH125_09110 [Afipia carboxidovorans]